MKKIVLLALVIGFTFAQTITPPQSDNFDGLPINIFSQAIFGHLGIIQIRCSDTYDKVETLYSRDLISLYICGETTRPFDSFYKQWDLFADWESRMPFTASPFTAWQRDDDNYNRSYSLDYDGTVFMVFYYDGLVLIAFRLPN